MTCTLENFSALSIEKSKRLENLSKENKIP